jgi:hypothetical protein
MYKPTAGFMALARQFLCFLSCKDLLVAGNSREHAFNKGNRTVPGDQGAGKTNKAPDSNGSGKGSCDNGAKFVKFAVGTGRVVGGCFSLFFSVCGIFHDEIPFEGEMFSDGLIS